MQGDDVKALLQDAVCPDPTSLSLSGARGSTKITEASKGLTAAGASLLASDYVDSETGVGNRRGDGSDRPIREQSGEWVSDMVYMLILVVQLVCVLPNIH